MFLITSFGTPDATKDGYYLHIGRL